MNTNTAHPDIDGCTSICGDCAAGYRRALREGGLSGTVPDCLIAFGLLRKLDGSPDHLPVPPSVAAITLARPIKRAIRDQRAALDTMIASLSPMETVYRHERQRHKAHVQPLIGRDVIDTAVQGALESCSEELLSAHPEGGRPSGALTDALPRDLALAGRGVRQRTIYGHTVRAHAPTLAHMERVTQEGAEVRTVGERFERLIVCDRTAAFIAVLSESGNQAYVLEIREPGLIQYLTKTFEGVWERAVPVEFDTTGQRPPQLTDEIQRTILELMVRGHTDEAISKRLGLSTRTIGAHIKRAATRFGSRSRAELGFSLARAGALDTDRGRPRPPGSGAHQRGA
ncbi:LuxR C-terminal-related transcriptional regulator [Streptomyces sp. H27-H1]|uniref:helix-turn-helix transcriptional regulator n=1 Tax=Streptomyces sp. H27-H1 TaxID=2996461 RepID=UPI00226D5B3F|nr:LuxR C-terminal-related transcriptional regulator [Streptomyces sp. H27-H1]MCY0926391.1 LuxR C-terminal-related transcriptional regulator [Streptomyces sp. H27-H1]